MRGNKAWLLIAFILALSTAWSQEAAPGTVPVSVIVSVEARHGAAAPVIYKEDVRAFQGKNRLQVTDWVPLQGSEAGLDLFLLIDDATDPASQLNDLRAFINSQPATTAIGVGYMHNGTVDIRQFPTSDHALAASAVHIPAGAPSVSPYLSVTDLIKRWPATNNRHAILMITSGIDALEPGPDDSYLAQAIELAQRSDVEVYSIYSSRIGPFGDASRVFNLGQSDLEELASATGAEFYSQTLRTPISFEPYLNEFADRLQHQFKLTFLIKAGDKGEFRHIKLETEVPHVELQTQDKVYVPAGR